MTQEHDERKKRSTGIREELHTQVEREQKIKMTDSKDKEENASESGLIFLTRPTSIYEEKYANVKTHLETETDRIREVIQDQLHKLFPALKEDDALQKQILQISSLLFAAS